MARGLDSFRVRTVRCAYLTALGSALPVSGDYVGGADHLDSLSRYYYGRVTRMHSLCCTALPGPAAPG